MSQDWTLSFMYPAAIIASVGVLIFLFLVPKPSHVGLSLNTKVITSMVSIMIIVSVAQRS